MKNTLRGTWRIGATLLLLCTEALASDYYVDAVNGSDANGGTSTSDAWRTITHALANVSYLDTLFVAPGTYDSALGEIFPLHANYHLIGTAGSSATIIDGGSSGATLISTGYTEMQGITLRDGANGVVLGDMFHGGYCKLTDVVIEDVGGFGVYGSVFTTEQYGVDHLDAVLDHVTVTNCGAGGVYLGDDNFQGSLTLHASSSQFLANGGEGVNVASSGGHLGGEILLESCLFQDNAASAVVGSLIYNSGTALFDCVLVQNGAGVGSGKAGLHHCTVAYNRGIGVTGTPNAMTYLDNTILFRNVDDVSGSSGGVVASHCDIGDGDFAGTNGNIAVAPKFVDAVSGDFHLRFGSACIDAGDPSESGIDGNLDTIGRSDIGAYEFAPLACTDVPHIGTTISLELWGPDMAQATVYWSRVGLATTPRATPFGPFYLAPSSAKVLVHSHTEPGPPNVVPIALPNDPSLVGRKLSFQVLIASAAAPAGSAFSNPLELTLEP
jgi:hypothetical protein